MSAKEIQDRKMKRLFDYDEHIGDWRVLVQTHDIQDGAICSRHIAPGAITPSKIAPQSIPLDMALANFVLPWFEIEDGYLVAYYASDGAIKDIGLDEDTGELWVLVTDNNPAKDTDDGWGDVEYLHDRRVMVSKDLTNEICPVALIEGGECTVIYENTTCDTDFTVTISSEYKTPDGKTVSLIVPHCGYAEVSWLRTGGVLYVRGV